MKLIVKRLWEMLPFRHHVLIKFAQVFSEVAGTDVHFSTIQFGRERNAQRDLHVASLTRFARGVLIGAGTRRSDPREIMLGE